MFIQSDVPVFVERDTLRSKSLLHNGGCLKMQTATQGSKPIHNPVSRQPAAFCRTECPTDRPGRAPYS